jgi:hypothetical protein
MMQIKSGRQKSWINNPKKGKSEREDEEPSFIILMDQ